jgi:hypothetical protein
MRRRIHRLVIAIVLLSSIGSRASELRYQWKKDATGRYQYEVTTHWKGGAMLTVRTQLAERVRAVRADGRGVVELTLETLEASYGAQSVDLREQVPASERTLVVIADAKGHFVVPQAWRIGLRDGVPFVLPRGLGDRAKGGWMVDVVPRRILDLLVLPNGAVERGTVVPVRNGKVTLQWQVASFDGATATLYVTNPAPRPARGEGTDLVVHFDTAQGQLLEVRGTLMWTESTKTIARVFLQRLAP